VWKLMVFRTAVPKATIDENDGARSREDDVRSAPQTFEDIPMLPEAESSPMKLCSQMALDRTLTAIGHHHGPSRSR
jgi:hypothetical protein